MKVSRRVIVHGKVQGVGYRAFVEDEAQRLGLGGWVRNRPDGTVEAVFVGEAQAVEATLAACRQGPRFARVTSVEASDAGPDAAAEPGRFTVRPTG